MAIIVPPSDARTALQIVQAFSRKIGYPNVGGLFGSNDAGALQMLEILQEVGDFCSETVSWGFSQRLAEWAALRTEFQGAYATLFPDGFVKILPGTFYNRSEQEEIYGPLTHAEWQEFKARGVSVTSYAYENNESLYLHPAPTAGELLALTYQSSHWVVTEGTNVSKALMTADSDRPLVPRRVLEAGLAFYWKRSKELPYAVEEARFMDMLYDSASKSGLKPQLNMGAPILESRPQIIVPRVI